MKSLILHSAELRSLLSTGRCEVRRLVRPQPEGDEAPDCTGVSRLGSPSEVRWVRETWHTDEGDMEYARAKHEDTISPSPIYYKATEEERNPNAGWIWRSASTMPRWASRLNICTLSVSVKLIEGEWWWVGTVEKAE